MSDLTEGTHPRVFETISQVVELVADNRVPLATNGWWHLLRSFRARAWRTHISLGFYHKRPASRRD